MINSFEIILKNKNNIFAKNHCEIKVCTILVCTLYSIKYGEYQNPFCLIGITSNIRLGYEYLSVSFLDS